MRKSEEQEKFYRAEIQSLMIKNPTISLRGLQEVLDEQNLHLDLHYIAKLKDKVVKERTKRIFKSDLKYIAELEDEMKLKVKKYWEIIDSPNPFIQSSDRIAAMRGLREERYKFLEALMNSGAIKRELGTFKVEHEISPAVLAAIKCLEMQFANRKQKDIIYEDAIIVEQKDDGKSTEQKPKPSPNVRELPGGGTIDDKGPAITVR